MSKKMKPFFLILSFLAFVGVTVEVPMVLAETKTVKKKKGQSSKKATKPKANTSGAKQKKTIGELLKQADRGAGVQLEKKGTLLPTFSQPVVNSKESSGSRVNQVDLYRVKPPSSSSFYSESTGDQAKLEKIIDQQISELYKLTQKMRNSPNRGELWLRLAELYVEKAGIIDFQRQERYDRELIEFQAGRRRQKPVLDLREAKDFNKKAVQLYEWFVRDFPRDPKMDQALFFLGYNNYELGNLKEGTNYYKRLTEEYPRSSFVTESQFALAEYYFENEKWREARKYYSDVVKNRRHRLYSFSLYKVAWCQYREGDARQAMNTLEKLIREEKVADRGDGDGKQVNRNKLESEGLRDMVLFYAEGGKADDAFRYFESLVGRDMAGSYVEKLAYYYADKGNREGARVLFNELIGRNPTNPKAFDYKYQIVKVYSTANKTREFRDELYSWIKDFGEAGQWYSANRRDSELISNSDKLREQTLKAWVLQQHQTAQNSRATFSQNLAFEGYRLYITEFKKSPVLADMHFYFGELLYDMGRFDDAGAQYRWVVENGEGSKFYGKAAENTVLALERNIPKDEEIAARVGKNLEPVALEPKLQRFVDAGTWYTNKFPNGEKTPEIRFRIARLYYQHNQFEQAAPLFRDVIQKYPKTKYSEYSANLLLDSYNLRKDYSGLEKTAGELLAIPSIASSEAGADIRGVMEKANFKKAQDLELEKKFDQSAKLFEEFARQNPRSELAVTAQFNAGINYERAGLVGSAIAMHNAVIASGEKNAQNLKPKSQRILAKLYQDTGDLALAARAYRESAVAAGNDPLAANLFFNAAVLDEALGKNTSSINNYDAFYQRAKGNREKNEALFSMAQIYRKSEKLSAATLKYKDFVNMGGTTPAKNIEAAFWVYQISGRLRRPGDVEEWRDKTLALQRRAAPQKKGVGANFAAKIKLDDAMKTFTEFSRIRLNNLAKIKLLLDLKTEQLVRLNKELGDVIAYDSPEEIVSSLYLLGRANIDMGLAIQNSPVPAELTKPEEIQMYRTEIGKKAEPFMAKGVESLQLAISRGKQFLSFGADYQKSVALIAEIKPELAPLTHFSQPVDTRVSSWIGGGQ